MKIYDGSSSLVGEPPTPPLTPYFHATNQDFRIHKQA